MEKWVTLHKGASVAIALAIVGIVAVVLSLVSPGSVSPYANGKAYAVAAWGGSGPLANLTMTPRHHVSWYWIIRLPMIRTPWGCPALTDSWPRSWRRLPSGPWRTRRGWNTRVPTWSRSTCPGPAPGRAGMVSQAR
jgi:hypothetical protein